MRWGAQAMHVARKDIRQLRWLLGGYAVITLWAALVGGEWIRTRSEWLGFPPSFYVVLAAMFALAILVQADSPWRSDAFWPSRPLHPLAVLAAKLLMTLSVLAGLPLVGHAAALAAHGLGGAALLALLPPSLGALLAWLALAGTVAALTADLRGFVTALLVLLTAGTAAGALLAHAQHAFAVGGGDTVLMAASVGVPVPGWFLPAGTVLLAVVMIYTYHRRSRRGGAILAGACLLALMLLRNAWPATGPDPDDSLPAELRHSLAVTASLQPAPAPGLVLAFELADAGDGYEYSLQWPRVELETSPGVWEALEVRSPYVLVAVPGSPLGAGVRWHPRADPAPWASTRLFAELTPRQRALVERGGRLNIAGTVHARSPVPIARLPLETGAAVVERGYRLRLNQVLRGDEDVVVELASSVVVPPGDTPFLLGFLRRTTYALAAPERGEALELAEGNASVASAAGLVLPGAAAWRSDVWLRTGAGVTGEIRVDPGAPPPLSPLAPDQWVELVVLHWQPLGGYRVSLDTRVTS